MQINKIKDENNKDITNLFDLSEFSYEFENNILHAVLKIKQHSNAIHYVVNDIVITIKMTNDLLFEGAFIRSYNNQISFEGKLKETYA